MATPSASYEQIAMLVKSMTNFSATRLETAREEEQARLADQKLAELAKQMANEGRIKELHDAFIAARNSLDALPTARASKIVRTLVDACLNAKGQSFNEKEALCVESIEWAKGASLLYLSRSLRSRLVRLYNDIGKNVEASKIAVELAKELRKVDDKELSIEVALEESRAAFMLNNFSKAKTALATARTASHGFYTSATMQAQLDLHSGILYATEDKDYKTAYSYFFEAFEGFVQIGDKERATQALKYMCLVKVMLNESDQIRSLLDSEACQPYVKEKHILAMRELAVAFKERSLARFQKCLETYPSELNDDHVVKGHSSKLHETMLEKEISRIVEPYAAIDIKHICEKVNLPLDRIEKKLGMMILDQTLRGVINQQAGCLSIMSPPPSEDVYLKASDLVRALGKVIDACQQSSTMLFK
ncbi:unnamed protein product, partial [Mesorhabditis belari]|uniref:PCI domain-containing protein n=1 Tax=Mesorhabditis belari TaxID=2138241 RepID=A0AAF3F0H4_9BILA